MLAGLWLNFNNNIEFIDSWYIFQFSVHVSKQETNSLLVEKLRFHLSQLLFSVIIILMWFLTTHGSPFFVTICDVI